MKIRVVAPFVFQELLSGSGIEIHSSGLFGASGNPTLASFAVAAVKIEDPTKTLPLAAGWAEILPAGSVFMLGYMTLYMAADWLSNSILRELTIKTDCKMIADCLNAPVFPELPAHYREKVQELKALLDSLKANVRWIPADQNAAYEKCALKAQGL